MQRVIIMSIILLSTFAVQSQRLVRTLNSGWTFTLDKNPEVAEMVNLPHTWNKEDAFQDNTGYYRGTGTYSKKLYVPSGWQGRRLFLKFEGANQIVRLRVNGRFTGEHIGGYTGFVFDVSEYLNYGEENQLRIEVDNRHNKDMPPLGADFNFYGGIYRDLRLVVTNGVHFKMQNEAAGNLLVRTPEVSREKAKVNISGTVVNHLQVSRDIKVQVRIFNPEGEESALLLRKLRLKPGESKDMVFSHEIGAPMLWSPDTPDLYRLEASVKDAASNELLDDYATAFGCRWFEMDPEKGFFLNGKHLKLVGVNRHQDYKDLGNALPNVVHETDYRMIKAMGSNFVRIAHYPHDPEAYRLCDELGLLVWSEIPVINEVTDSEAYHQTAIQMQREQVLQFFNHPSVVMWGYMNEIFIHMVFNRNLTDAEREGIIETSVDLARKLDRETKALDPDRLTAMAIHKNEIYNTTGIADIPDVLGWNLYFGWYEKGLENLGKFLDEQQKRYPERSLIISEYGPGADVRIQTNHPKPWDYSEAYQLKSHESYYRQIMERPYVAGMAAWNFADFGSSGRQDALPFINQKGLLTFDRTPKDVYHYYQALLLDEPHVHIAGEHWPVRYCPDDVNGKGEVKVPVFSNQDEVTLLMDGGGAQTQSVANGLAFFSLALPEGKHRLKATAGEAEFYRDIEVHLRSRMLETIDQKDINVNAGTHCSYIDPLTNEVWVSDQAYSPGSWGYLGGEVFQRNPDKFQGTPINILGTDNDPLYQTMREGLDGYRFDVGKGRYRVTLLFAEYNRRASGALIYNLSEEEMKDTSGVRAFAVKINGTTVVPDLNLARDYGAGRAVSVAFDVQTNNGIMIEFDQIAGKPILSGIKVEKR